MIKSINSCLEVSSSVQLRFIFSLNFLHFSFWSKNGRNTDKIKNYQAASVMKPQGSLSGFLLQKNQTFIKIQLQPDCLVISYKTGYNLTGKRRPDPSVFGLIFYRPENDVNGSKLNLAKRWLSGAAWAGSSLFAV